MRNQRLRALAALITLGAMSLAPVALAPRAEAAVPGQIAITEWMYSPTLSTNAEFVEVTNIGGAPVDMSTYFFDDDSRTPGSFSLSGLGTLAAGESALIVEKTAAAFRTEWGLAASVKIADGNTNNLGAQDEINIFNGSTLVDRLSYGDTKFVGSISTKGKSGVPTSCLGVGANNVGLWALSAVGDSRGSYASVSNDIGSPGTSPLNACGPVTIVGGAGTGNPNTLPCTPEAPSGTGPAPANAQTWPGSATVSVADKACAWITTTGPEGRDMSGLVFDPSDPGVLWAAKNKNWIFRMVQQNGLWVPDTANGWGAGKQIVFPNGAGQPDSEGLTVGPDGALYVTTERNNANNTFALNSVLRFDPTASGTTLTPTQQWDLTADFPELVVAGGDKTKANLGFEGVTFVPDTYLVQNHFIDDSTGLQYNPSSYPLHGTGLFFAALENDGKLYAYALNSDGTKHRVSVADTGMGHVMDVQFDRDLQRIWALCDNTCAVSSTLMKVSTSGVIVPDVVYARPTGLPNLNIEGFAIAPDSTCSGGFKGVVWADDGIAGVGFEGHALYAGTFPCGLQLGGQGATLCTPGSFSTTGIVPCTPAPAGSYVDVAGATSATPCAKGSFSDNTGSLSCTLAPAGLFVDAAGATSATPCLPGTYSDVTGAAACKPAPAGSYVDGAGATSATPCPTGSFSDVVGSVSCTLAPAGKFVAGTGATSATDCATGTYNAVTGAVACTPAAVGSYVATTGATSQTACPSGTTTNGTGSTSAAACIPPLADLSVTVSCPTTVKLGATVTCTLTTRNKGPLNAASVVAELGITNGLTVTSVGDGATVSRNIVSWRIPTLASNGTATLTITAKATSTGRAGLAAAVASANRDPNWLNNLAAAIVTVSR